MQIPHIDTKIPGVSGLPQMSWFCNFLLCFSSMGHLQLFLLNDKLHHYCMNLVVAFNIPSMRSCFWTRHMLLVVRSSSVDQFCCSGVLSAIFCWLLQHSRLPQSSLFHQNYYYAKYCLICFQLKVLFASWFCLKHGISCSSMECQKHEMLSFQYLPCQVTIVIVVTIVCQKKQP